MFKKIFKKSNGDSASMVYPDGSESNSELHEQMVAGVDDTELRQESARQLIANGLDEGIAKRMMGVG